MEERFGFDGKKPTPADPRAVEFCHKLVDMLYAQKALEVAYEKVPSYTAQWEPEDYYAEAQEDFNRAADALWEFIRSK